MLKNRFLGIGMPSWKTVAFVLVITFAWTLGGAGNAVAVWDDQSDQLPGMDESNTAIYIGAAAAAVLVIYLIVKKSGSGSAAQANVLNPGEIPADNGLYPVIVDALDSQMEPLAPTAIADEPKRQVDPFVYLKQDRVGVGVGVSF